MRFLSNILSIALVFGVVMMIVVMLVIGYYSRDLPDYTHLETYEPPIATRVHASDGHLLEQFALEHRVFVPYEAIPKQVIQAFLAAEDKNFYHHSGIDVMGILRAVFTNIYNLSYNKRPVGASTITQQVAKNFLLSNEVSFERKFKEILLSFRLEQAYTKNKILELYLNEIFLGQRSYGVAAAALNYFDKSLDELNVEEIAYLAALPKGPNNYHPKRRFQAAVERRNWVLGRMYEDGYIDRSTYDMARITPLVTVDGGFSDFPSGDYFVEEVRRELVELYGQDKFYQGGLSVRTPLNTKYQEVATKVMREGLEAYDRRHGWRGPIGKLADLEKDLSTLDAFAREMNRDGWRVAVVQGLDGSFAHLKFSDGGQGRIQMDDLKWARRQLATGRGPVPTAPSDILNVGDIIPVKLKVVEGQENKQNYELCQIPQVQGALVAMDPHTGRVLALVGGYSFTKSKFNRATQALRQPGSSFKPFVYAAALENGFTPSTIVMDAPFAISQGPGMPMWRPKNYSHDFLGPIPIRVGLEKSRNLMTVRLAQYVGMEKVAEISKRFGVADDLPLSLAMSLGAHETTLLKMTAAYSVFANGGKKVTPSFVDKIQDRHGKIIYKQDQRPCENCSNVEWPDESQESADFFGQPIPLPAVPEIPDQRPQIIDARYAFQMVSIMEGVVERGTGWRLRELKRNLGGKTGTSNDAKDAWFIGFSPNLTIGVFVGFDDPSPLGGLEGGSMTASPIAKEFIAATQKNDLDVPFRIPPGLRQVKINPLNGKPPKTGEKFIWESFIPGTEPYEGPVKIIDGSEESSEPVHKAGQSEGNPEGSSDESPEGNPIGLTPEENVPRSSSPLTGTGGLY